MLRTNSRFCLPNYLRPICYVFSEYRVFFVIRVCPAFAEWTVERHFDNLLCLSLPETFLFLRHIKSKRIQNGISSLGKSSSLLSSPAFFFADFEEEEVWELLLSPDTLSPVVATESAGEDED